MTDWGPALREWERRRKEPSELNGITVPMPEKYAKAAIGELKAEVERLKWMLDALLSMESFSRYFDDFGWAVNGDPESDNYGYSPSWGFESIKEDLARRWEERHRGDHPATT